jgi:tetratricopeptide (TPR) repeat protein
MSLWEQSLAKEPSVWAYRNLAMAYTNELGDSKKGLEYMQKALALDGAKENIFFLKDYATMSTNCGADREWIETYQELSETLKAHKRLQVYLSLAYLHVGEYQKTMEIIKPDFVLNDIKEGELSMSKIWTDMHVAMLQDKENLSLEEAEKQAEIRYPLPYELDFRMHELKKEK